MKREKESGVVILLLALIAVIFFVAMAFMRAYQARNAQPAPTQTQNP